MTQFDWIVLNIKSSKLDGIKVKGMTIYIKFSIPAKIQIEQPNDKGIYF
jgi:hypothetical protein